MPNRNNTAIDLSIAAAVLFLAAWFWGGAAVPENPFPDGSPRCYIHHEAREDSDLRTIGAHSDLREFFGEGLRIADDDVRPEQEPWGAAYDWAEARGGGRYFVMRNGSTVREGELPEGLDAAGETILAALESIR